MDEKDVTILEDFVGEDIEEQEIKKKRKIKNEKKKIIKERDGLIERIDKTLVTEDGRQLLRERYY